MRRGEVLRQDSAEKTVIESRKLRPRQLSADEKTAMLRERLRERTVS